MKFSRNYELSIELDTKTHDTIVIKPPLTLNFNIVRNTLASANTGTISIYNLAEANRKRIYQDRFDTTTYRRVVLRAGYGQDLATIFRGNLRMAQSQRQGVDYVTELDSFDGGFGIINGFTSKTWPGGTDQKKILGDIIKDMPNVILGKVGDFSGSSYRGTSLIGSPWSLIPGIAGDGSQPFIDNEVANVLKNNETLSGDIEVIEASTGLLETPRRNDAVIEVKMLFEPRLVVGQVIELRSRETVYNGQYKVIGFTHSGTISAAVNGQCTTTASLWIGSQKLKAA